MANHLLHFLDSWVETFQCGFLVISKLNTPSYITKSKPVLFFGARFIISFGAARNYPAHLPAKGTPRVQLQMIEDHSYLQVKKCEFDNVDGIYTSSDGGDKYYKDQFCMYRNSSSGFWNIFENVGERNIKICSASKSGNDVTLVNWILRTQRGDKSSVMKVSICPKSRMQTRSSSSASLLIGTESSRVSAYESLNVYSSKPIGGPDPTPRQVHTSPGLMQQPTPDRPADRRNAAVGSQSDPEYVLKLQNDLQVVHANNMALRNSLRDSDQVIEDLTQKNDRLSKQGEHFQHQLQALQAERAAKPPVDERAQEDLRRIRQERSQLTVDNRNLSEEVDRLKARIASSSPNKSPDASASLQNENATLRSRISKLEGDLVTHQTKASQLQEQVYQREDDAARIKAELKTLTHQHHDVLRAQKNSTEPTLQQVTAQKSRIAELEKELAAEKTLTSALKDKVGDLEKIIGQSKKTHESQIQQLILKCHDDVHQWESYVAELEAAHAEEMAEIKKQHHALLHQIQRAADEMAVHAAAEYAAALAKERDHIKDFKDKEKAASVRADNLMARAGKSYIKRDVQQTNLKSTFPPGDTFLADFKKDFLGMDTFLNDATNVVEDTEHVTPAKAASVVVDEVIVPLHAACAQYVQRQLQAKKRELETKFGAEIDEEQPDGTAAVFWYAHVQPLFLAEVQALSDEFILQTCLCPRARDLHARMQAAVVGGTIEGGEGVLTLPAIARLLLHALAVAALSVPRCYLYPAPGQMVRYREGFTKEVLSPGTKKHGRIVEGAEVEVVFSGLYFDRPTEANFNKMTPSEACLVRRV